MEPGAITERFGHRTVKEKWALRRLLAYETGRPNSLLIRSEGKYDLRRRAERKLRRRVREALANQGFSTSKEGLGTLSPVSKDSLRQLHSAARVEKYSSSLPFIRRCEEHLLGYFANGDEIDVKAVRPWIQVVPSESDESDLFRYACLLWSVPVSGGFGRRTRFLVWDENNGKLIGLYALGDPVYNLRCRDAWIGWDHRTRSRRLYNVMDIFVLGAVPPYNLLLGGKLVALAAASDETRETIRRRYAGNKTIISGVQKDPRLALLTTGSALGKSSLYDRIRCDGRLVFRRIGTSQGYGHFHLNNGLFEALRTYLDGTVRGKASSYKFGMGPNWRMRTSREALENLGLSGDLLRHGIRREIYVVPLAPECSPFLRGETNALAHYSLPFEQASAYWEQRWLLPRADRKPEYREFRRTSVSRLVRDLGGAKL